MEIHNLNKFLYSRINKAYMEIMYTKNIYSYLKDLDDDIIVAYKKYIAELADVPYYLIKDNINIVKIDYNDYLKNDPYVKNIKLDDCKFEEWDVNNCVLEPYSLMLYKEENLLEDGSVCFNFCFDDKEICYTSVGQDMLNWMLLTPYELETSVDAINKAKGNVITYGLGLGYFTYMVSLKDEVDSITVVELNNDLIKWFKNKVLPQFENKDKIKIINADAFDYIKNSPKYDLAFIDIWRTCRDGYSIYQELKKYERDDTEYIYWIKDTMDYTHEFDVDYDDLL